MEMDLQEQLDALLDERLESAVQRERTAFDRWTAPHGDTLVLFGAGGLGRMVFSRLRSLGIAVAAFADNNPALWGAAIDGVPVISPHDAARRFGARAAMVVTIRHSGYAFPETRDQLAALGCTTVLSYVSLFWKYPQVFLPHYFLDLPHKILAQTEDVRRAFGPWADERSRREYVAQLRYRLLLDHDALAPQAVVDEYFPDDLLSLSAEEVFVDLGAYDGDTLRSLVARRGARFRRAYAFEPDPHNFRKLSRYVQALPAEIADKVAVREKAAGGTTGKIRFQGTATAEAAVSDSGTMEVDCAALDDLRWPHPPTFIKMDIEGSEAAAIEGARRTIQRHAPIIAASVYHRQEDLWSIPLLLQSLSDQYRFFLRAQDLEGWDLVCYAVPVARLSSQLALTLAEASQ
jgi:FkbM family methyltransferase